MGIFRYKRQFGSRYLVSAIITLCLAVLAIAWTEAIAEELQPTKSELAALKELGEQIKGFVVWESNRTGQWELYRINTDGSGFKQITQLGKNNKLPYNSYLRPRTLTKTQKNQKLFSRQAHRERRGNFLL